MFQETKTWTKNNSRMKYIPSKVVLREVSSALLICVYRMNHGIAVIHLNHVTFLLRDFTVHILYF